MAPRVEIKGIREGLLVTVGEGEWGEIERSLIEQVQRRSAFIQGARLTLDVGQHELHPTEMGALVESLTRFGVSVHAVLSKSLVTETSAQGLGLGTRISQSAAKAPVRLAPVPERQGESLFLRKTLRSGVKIEFAGDVTVIGEVNPGAEIVASGSVVIWGRLRGVVHAGAEGDGEAVVCALGMTPTQLRIAGQVSIPAGRSGKVQPEIARLTGGQVIIETWEAK